MTKAPFKHKGQKTSDLLELIRSDVYSPMDRQAKERFQYFITLTDDFGQYGYIYLIRHKTEVLEKYKEFKK
ncbi:hypothetical protein GQ457_05G023690 [Hibiscus cannabinus]